MTRCQRIHKRADHPLTQALLIMGAAIDRIAQEIRLSSSRKGTELMKHLEKAERIYAYLSDQQRNCRDAA